MLKYLNEKFIYSSKKTKIELYILPILIISLLFIFFDKTQIQNENITPKVENYELGNRKMKENILEIISKIENLAKENTIFIIKSEKKELEIFLSFSGELNNIFEFIAQIERLNSFSNIKFINYKKEENKNLVNLKVDFSKFFIKKLSTQTSHERVFLKDNLEFNQNNQEIEKIENSFEEIEKIDFKINAIVGDFAFINGVWVKKNEEISGFKLIKIFRDYVVLKNKNEEIKLELSYAKYLKNLD